MKTNLASRRSSSVALLRRRFVVASLLGALATGGSLALPTARAQTITSAVPALLSYQGRVTTPAGALVGAGTPVNRTVTFRIWSHATNSLTTDLVYSEQQVATISEGEFSVLIGQGTATSGTPLGYSETTKGKPTVTIADAGVFGSAVRYLGVTVDDGNSGTIDPEISPRQQIVTSAFAFRAKYAESLGSNGISSLTTLDNGNVGIGTTNPAQKLQVTGNTLTTGSAYLLDGNHSIRATAGSGISLSTYLVTDGLILKQETGNVGIGTTSPQTKLEVNGNIAASAAGGYVFGGGDTDTGMFSAGDNLLTFKTAGVERVRVNNSGLVGIGVAPAYTLHVRSDTPEILVGNVGGTAGALYFGNSGHGVKRNFNGTTNDVGLYTSSGDVYLSANGPTTATHFVLKNNGNVGIGSTTTTDKLTVAGNVRAFGVNAAFTVADSANVARGYLATAGGAGNYSTDAAANDVILRAESGSKLLLQSNGNASAIAITSDNRVGIGNAAPAYKLDISGQTRITTNTTQGLIIKGSGDNTIPTEVTFDKTISGSSHTSAVGYATDRGAYVWVNGNDRLNLRTNGQVGIGMVTPSESFVHINGSVDKAGLVGAYINGDVAGSRTTHASHPISLRTSGTIWSGNAVIATSDARVKLVQGQSDGSKDLQTMMSLEVTDYRYKDVIGQGDGLHKKVIAQQVEKIYPQAVNVRTGTVPDIYRQATVTDRWVNLATNLKPGERVRLVGEGTDDVFEVVEATPARFRTAFASATAKVFVYGREVKDFRTVDYDAISMLNVSAVQQLKRDTDGELKSLRTENAALRTQLAAQARRLAEAEAKNATRDARLAAIEKLLSAPSTVMALPAALPTASGQQ